MTERKVVDEIKRELESIRQLNDKNKVNENLKEWQVSVALGVYRAERYIITYKQLLPGAYDILKERNKNFDTPYTAVPSDHLLWDKSYEIVTVYCLSDADPGVGVVTVNTYVKQNTAGNQVSNIHNFVVPETGQLDFFNRVKRYVHLKFGCYGPLIEGTLMEAMYSQVNVPPEKL